VFLINLARLDSSNEDGRDGGEEENQIKFEDVVLRFDFQKIIF
jgi:hypothetical protein